MIIGGIYMKIILVNFFLLFFPFLSHAEGLWSHIQEIEGNKIGIVRSIAEGPDSTLWFGSDNGLFSYKDGQWKSIKLPEGQLTVPTVGVDSNGSVWIVLGYPLSLAKFSNGNWITIPSEGWLPYELSVAPDDKIWIRTNQTSNNIQASIYRYDGNTFTLIPQDSTLHKENDPYGNISYLKVMPNGDVWCRYGEPIFYEGPQRKFYGVSRYNGTDWKTFSVADGLLRNEVTSIAGDRMGNVAVSYEIANGISLFNGQTWKTLATAYGGFIAYGPDNILWCANIYGGYLRRYDGLSWITYNVMPYFLGLSDIIVDNKNTVWLATDNGIISFRIDETSISKPGTNPLPILIKGNYPNPFNQMTAIEYYLSKEGNIKLEIYSLSGQKIRTLVSGNMKGGIHSITWEGRNEKGISVASGLYLCCLTMNKLTSVRRIILLK
jgi:streptogramin lyase